MRILVLALLLTSTILTGQMNLSPGLFAGSRAWQTDSISYDGGADHGVYLHIYPQHDPNVEAHIFAQASGAYTSVYNQRLEETIRFLHIRGGVGITNSKYVYAILNAGYLTNVSQNASSVPTIDGELGFMFPERSLGGLQFTLSGIAGFTFYNPYYLKTTDNLGYFAGRVGVCYRFSEKKNKDFLEILIPR